MKRYYLRNETALIDRNTLKTVINKHISCYNQINRMAMCLSSSFFSKCIRTTHGAGMVNGEEAAPSHPVFCHSGKSEELKEMTNHDKGIEEHLLVPLVWVALLLMMRCDFQSNIFRNSRLLSAIIHLDVGCCSL